MFENGKGLITTRSKIEIRILKKLVNVKMEILDVVAKWGGSVTDASVSILLFTGFSFSTLNSSRVLSMAFTSSAFAVIFAFVVFNSDSSFSSLFTFVSSFSL